jgi:hypothetical protein
MKKKNPNKPHRPRSPLAVHVARRNVNRTPFKHRLEPKQGAKNDQPELLEESVYSDDECLCETHEQEVITTFCPIHGDSEEEHECDL